MRTPTGTALRSCASRLFGTTCAPKSRDRFLSFEEARAHVRSAGLKSWMEWASWCAAGARPPNIPSNPQQFYGTDGGWRGIADWLGYEKQTGLALSKRERSRTEGKSDRRLAQQRDTAKEQFLAHLPTGHEFEFRSLPHRCLAQFVYRDSGSVNVNELWCPLALRSGHSALATNCILFDLPRSPDGDGVFFVLRSSQRLFFFPHAYLDAHYRPKKSGRLIAINMREAAKFEVAGPEKLVQVLHGHLRSSTLLSETELSSKAMFSLESDVERYTLMRQAVHFLRDACGLAIERPAAHSFDAHFVLGEKNIIGRLCRSDSKTAYPRVQWSDRGRRPGCPLRSDEESMGRGADFLLGLIGDEKNNACDARPGVPRLKAIFLFPSSYLLSLKYMGSIDGVSQSPREWTRSTLLVYPPWASPKQAETKKRQADQSNYFIDLSPEADMNFAAKRARTLLSM